MVKSLSYALCRNLRTDKFVFRRTAGAIISSIQKGGISFDILEKLEQLLVEANLSPEQIRLTLLEEEFKYHFGNGKNTTKNSTYMSNLKTAQELFEILDNKKEAARASLEWKKVSFQQDC